MLSIFPVELNYRGICCNFSAPCPWVIVSQAATMDALISKFRLRAAIHNRVIFGRQHRSPAREEWEEEINFPNNNQQRTACHIDGGGKSWLGPPLFFLLRMKLNGRLHMLSWWCLVTNLIIPLYATTFGFKVPREWPSVRPSGHHLRRKSNIKWEDRPNVDRQ